LSVLLLISGGASSLLEVPAPGIGLAELRALFERSLDERLDIARLNRERSALSRIKGGRLPDSFAGRALRRS
jgi:hydroxypyruvate reductase